MSPNSEQYQENKTLFVLGAGVSNDHGYPTGIELLEDLKNSLDCTRLLGINLIGTVLENNQHIIAILLVVFDMSKGDSVSEEVYDEYLRLTIEFSSRLMPSFPRSIDDFVKAQVDAQESEGAKEKVRKIGKVLIVLTLLKYENLSLEFASVEGGENRQFKRLQKLNKSMKRVLTLHKPLHKNAPTFYTELWKEVYGKNYEEFIGNLDKFSVITFNYDRLFEHFFYENAINFYPTKKVELTERLNNFFNNQCIHVYGRLGKLSWEAQKNSVEYGVLDFEVVCNDINEIVSQTINNLPNGSQSYTTDTQNSVYFDASKSIANILENQSDNKKYSKMCLHTNFIFESIDRIKTYSESISSSTSMEGVFKHVYFLGISFHSVNLERIENIVRFEDVGKLNREVHACIYGMGDAEVEKALSKIKNYIPELNKSFFGFGKNSKKKLGLDNKLKIPDFFKYVDGVRYID